MRKQRSSASSRQKDERKMQRRTDRTSLADQRVTPNQRNAKSSQSSFRAGLAVIGGRAAGALSRRLHLGGGTSIAGIVAQRIDPNIVGHLAAQLQHGSILVTGTNGKTTTSGFIAAILSDAGLRVWRNREGSNLGRGIAGALVIRARSNGRLRRAGQAISIFEVDEAVMPRIVQSISPRIAVFTNLFRDQLDRYGEVDSVAMLWQEAVGSLPGDTTLILNADDPTTAHLGELFTGQVIYFGIDDPLINLTDQVTSAERHQAIDTRTCPHCGNDFTYTMRFYSHMGHYYCPHCGYTRPQPDIRAVSVHNDSFDRLRILLDTSTQEGEVIIPLPGLYNIYNALAAIAVAKAMEISWEPIVSGIEQFKPIFGRGERVQVEGRTLRLFLAKNPTGFNEVLRTLFSTEMQRHVLFILNDNIADGRDISWIWDVDFERVLGLTKTLVIAGTRSLDLALRLKYAGIAQQELTIVPPAPLQVAKRNALSNDLDKQPLSRGSKRDNERNVRLAQFIPSGGNRPFKSSTIRRYGIAEALNSAISQTPVGETLFVVPTYTGLLEVHHELERRGLTPHYWEGQGP